MCSRNGYLPAIAHPACRPRRLSQLSEARLPAALEAAAIRRLAEAAGGFATVLRKGDPDRGSLLLSLIKQGRHAGMLERMLQSDGGYRWESCGPPDGAEPSAVIEFVAKRTRFDADLWLIELDVPDTQRFIAEISANG